MYRPRFTKAMLALFLRWAFVCGAACVQLPAARIGNMRSAARTTSSKSGSLVQATEERDERAMTGTTKPLVGVSHVRSDLCDPVRPVGAVKSVRCRSLHIQKEMETL